MRTLTGLLVAITLATSAATSPAQEPTHTPDPAITDGSAAKALATAKARWRAKGPASYRFRIARSCFCPPAYRDPRTVTVRGGRPVRPPAEFRDVATVPRLFRVVRKAIEDGAAHLTVKYDTRYGYPRSISIDSREFIADEEDAYTADRLERLPPRR